MYRKVDDFLKEYEELSAGTTKHLEACDDLCLDQAVAKGHRTIRDLAWHIVTTIPEMMNRTGLGISGVDHTSMPPKSAAEIRDRYKAVTQELLAAVKANWKDETLLESDDMYGMRWQRGESLAGLVAHEVHHRAQIGVLMRQAGRETPGVFGPAKHEWATMGMEPPPY